MKIKPRHEGKENDQILGWATKMLTDLVGDLSVQLRFQWLKWTKKLV